VKLNVPVFDLNDVSAVAALIMQQFPRRVRSGHELEA
jgi:hypothetical protein